MLTDIISISAGTDHTQDYFDMESSKAGLAISKEQTNKEYNPSPELPQPQGNELAYLDMVPQGLSNQGTGDSSYIQMTYGSSSGLSTSAPSQQQSHSRDGYIDMTGGSGGLSQSSSSINRGKQ